MLCPRIFIGFFFLTILVCLICVSFFFFFMATTVDSPHPGWHGEMYPPEAPLRHRQMMRDRHRAADIGERMSWYFQMRQVQPLHAPVKELAYDLDAWYWAPFLESLFSGDRLRQSDNKESTWLADYMLADRDGDGRLVPSELRARGDHVAQLPVPGDRAQYKGPV